MCKICFKIYVSAMFQVEYMPNIEISEYYRKHQTNKKKKILTGIYGHTEANTGGPFVSYIIENKYSNNMTWSLTDLHPNCKAHEIMANYIVEKIL